MKKALAILDQAKSVKQEGIAYLSMLLILALLSVASMSALTVASLAERRKAEEELLFIGQQFQAALTSFANATPPGMVRGPRSIDELLLDQRTNISRRHLRKLYFDPVTRENSWGVIHGSDGTIVGIHSLSELAPIKIDHFTARFVDFKNVPNYRSWVFSSSL